MSSRVALIIGAGSLPVSFGILVNLKLYIGPRVGTSVAQYFLSTGYKVVLASRKGENLGFNQAVGVKLDLNNPHEVTKVYKEIREKVGEPTVVLYNGELF